MRTIKVVEDLQIVIVSRPRDIPPIIEKIQPIKDSDIKLDLTGCIIDYKGTPELINYLLVELDKMVGNKVLTITSDIMRNEEEIIHYFLVECKFFHDLGPYSPSNKKYWIIELNRYLTSRQISLNIVLVNGSNDERYQYGKH